VTWFESGRVLGFELFAEGNAFANQGIGEFHLRTKKYSQYLKKILANHALKIKRIKKC